MKNFIFLLNESTWLATSNGSIYTTKNLTIFLFSLLVYEQLMHLKSLRLREIVKICEIILFHKVYEETKKFYLLGSNRKLDKFP